MKQRKHRFERRGRGEDRLLRDDKNCNYANWLRNIGIYVSRERERERCYFPNTTLLEEDRESFFPVPLR